MFVLINKPQLISLWNDNFKKRGTHLEQTITPSLNSNALKIIAVTAMIVDHATFWLLSSDSALYVILRIFGRFAAPIMCYLIAEGYFHTSNKKKYCKRLFIFALISHYPYILYSSFAYPK